MSALRDVLIRVSNVKTADVYEARSYPNADSDGDGRWELYETPVYEIHLEGVDRAGKAVTETWTGLRFMPYWNDPRLPSPHYRTRGWANSGLHYKAKTRVPAYLPTYELHNRVSLVIGAIQIEGNFLIHTGPADLTDVGVGGAGCVAIIGNFDTFRHHILALAGSAETDITRGMLALVAAHKLFVQIDLARPPDLKSKFKEQIAPRW